MNTENLSFRYELEKKEPRTNDGGTTRGESVTYFSASIDILLLWTGFLSGAFTAPSLLGYLGKWTFILPALLLVICGVLISKINYKNSYYVTEK